MKHPSSIPKARDLALAKHKKIITTVSGLERPFILHLQEVATLVWAGGGDDNQIAAAWLHDIVEDTDITLEGLRMQFNEDIVSIVADLTDPEEFKGMYITDRKTKQVERLSAMSPRVKVIKLADQISNIRSIIDPINDMSHEVLVGYQEGAKRIAHACCGINTHLDELFDLTYQMNKTFLSST